MPTRMLEPPTGPAVAPSRGGAPSRCAPAASSADLQMGNAALAELLGADPRSAGAGSPVPFRSANAAMAQTLSNAALLARRQAPPAAPAGAPGTAAAAPAGQPPRAASAATSPAATASTGAAAASAARTGPTLQNPASGIDWMAWWADTSLEVLRSTLELGRVVPGLGLYTGLAADAISVYRDFSKIRNEQGADTDLIRGIMALRSIAGAANGILGHFAYLDQMLQNVLVTSVVGAEFAALTAPVMEVIKLGKLFLDGVLLGSDVFLSAAARYKAANATGDSKEAWQGVLASFEANVFSDLFSIVVDLVDLASGGLGQAETVKQGTMAIKKTVDVAQIVGPMMLQIIQSWYNVWGGTILEPGGPIGPVAQIPQRAAGMIILVEVRQMKAGYMMGDAMLGLAGQYMAIRHKALDEFGKKLLGGKHPDHVVRDVAVKILGGLSKKAGDLQQMGAMASTAKEKATWVTGQADAFGAAVSAITVPDVEIPKAELGDNMVADAIEGVANTVGGAVNAGLDAVVAEFRALVDSLKAQVAEIVESVRAHAAEIAEFLQVLTDTAKEFAEVCRKKAADLGAKLSKCTSLEDVVDLILAQISEIVGADKALTVDQIRQWWKQLGVVLDEAEEWAVDLADGERPDAPKIAPGTGDPSKPPKIAPGTDFPSVPPKAGPGTGNPFNPPKVAPGT